MSGVEVMEEEGFMCRIGLEKRDKRKENQIGICNEHNGKEIIL